LFAGPDGPTWRLNKSSLELEVRHSGSGSSSHSRLGEGHPGSLGKHRPRLVANQRSDRPRMVRAVALASSQSSVFFGFRLNEQRLASLRRFGVVSAARRPHPNALFRQRGRNARGYSLRRTHRIGCFGGRGMSGVCVQDPEHFGVQGLALR
jgi:hypothetical protein